MLIAAANTNATQLLPLETMIWERPRHEGDFPSARYAHSLTPLGPSYVLFGGWGYGGMQTREEGNKRSGADSVIVLDSERMQWSVPELINPNPMVHKYGHTSTDVQGLMFVFGGWNGKQATNDLTIVEVTNNEEEESEDQK